ncbi:hypothetical protein LAZ67_16002953 [Cordylochernes scorpioides]|uniref:Uncharacterized protein n=1 Tax=Cordylochernes scorpioides TaxID=51811 RepID=A0ABY6LH72_9ARAC|nr:hypothetical protein LAZ67_16002953 [Cordylochernes scorpioides]
MESVKDEKRVGHPILHRNPEKSLHLLTVALSACTLALAAPQGSPYATAAQEYGPPKPYAFDFVSELLGGQMSRQEVADGSGRVTGSYTLQDEDGRRRTVEYVADENGFRATVRTNEQGTKSESPADVVLESSAPEPVLPLVAAGHVDQGRLRAATSPVAVPVAVPAQY